jgi:hypothetical protein
VDTLANTVKATPASGEITAGKFFVDDVAWRVMSKNVGTTYSNGMDVLILPVAADAFGTSQFNTANSGTYYNSFIRNTTLPEVFEKLYWAHDYAIKPGEQTSSMPSGAADVGLTLPGTATNTNDGGIAISTNTFARDAANYLDACFLMGWNETYRVSQIFGWTGNGNNGGADLRKAANNIDGTEARYFLRSVHNTSSYVDVVTYNGSGLYSGSATSGYGKIADLGFRPAMILRLPVEYTVHYYLEGTRTSIAPDSNVNGLMLDAGVTSVTEKAIEIDGYTVASAASLTRSFAADTSEREFIFYYTEE